MFTAVVYEKRATNLFQNKLIFFLTRMSKALCVLCILGVYRDFEPQIFAGFIKEHTCSLLCCSNGKSHNVCIE